MKKTLLSLFAVMLMTLAANAEKTITWDYNTIKGIDFECHYQSNFFIYPVISKDGITLSVISNWWAFSFKDCDFKCTKADPFDIPETEFFSTVGRITSIVITCTDENDALHDDANKYGWTESPTSASWSGDPLYKVMLPMEVNRPMKGIQKITFTVDNVAFNHYRIYSINGNWEINGEKVWKGLDYAEAGEKVVINPSVWIPEGKKIKSMKVVDLNSDKTTFLTDNGDGTWTLAAMPAYNVNMVVEYEDIPEVYTEFVEATGTLTYYYDDKRETRTGVTELYDPVGNPDAVRFTGYYKKVKKAVIDPSMKQAPLTSMYSMFFGGINGETFAFQTLSNMTEIKGMDNLNTANVTRMDWMFEACNSLQTIDVSSFDVSKVTKMDYMFGDCYKLTTIYCNDDWSNTSASSFYMFATCTSLVGGKGTTFDSEVKDKTYARPDGGPGAPGYFTEKPSLQGDLNGDGKVDIADAVTVLNIMAAGEYNASADLNGDGKNDIADFVTILNIMAAQ